MIDIANQLAAIYREVGMRSVDGGGEGVGVLMRRTYSAPVEDGGPTSIVELCLSPDGDEETVLEPEHTVPLVLAQSVAGALFVGPGWDGAFLGLDLYLRGEVADDPVAAANSLEAQAFSKESVQAWTTVVESSGAAGPEEIAAARAMSLAQFAPDADKD